MVANVISYQSETHQVSIGTMQIVVTDLTPVFASEEDRANVKQSIEYGLYRIFEKYS